MIRTLDATLHTRWSSDADADADSVSSPTSIVQSPVDIHEKKDNNAVGTCQETTIQLKRIQKIISNLPKPCTILPSSVTNLQECVRHEIHALQKCVDELNSPGDKIDNISNSQRIIMDKEVAYDALDDGFMICDLAVVQHKYQAWRKLFPRIKPFFAIKCNPDSMVTAMLASNQNVGFDCASISEIQLALSSISRMTTVVGNDHSSNQYSHDNENPTTDIHAPKRCVYANPQRSQSDLRESLKLGVEALTFDSIEELYKIKKEYDKRLELWKDQGDNLTISNYSTSTDSTRKDSMNHPMETMQTQPKPQPPEMILRILVPDGHSSIPLGEKFGAPPTNIKPLVRKSLELGLPLIGVSFHCGSGCHDPDAYGAAIQIAKDVLDRMNDIIADYLSNTIDKEYKLEVDEKKCNDDILHQTNMNLNLIRHRLQAEQCTLLDIGGGYPGVDGIGGDNNRFSGKCMLPCVSSDSNDHKDDIEEETASKIARVVTPLINELFPCRDMTSSTHMGGSGQIEGGKIDIQVISEPGRYFVEAAFAYCARIYSTHISEDSSGNKRFHYYISQGVQGLFKDVILCGEIFTPIPLIMDTINDDGSNMDNFSSTVHGPSGENFDVVCPDCFLPELKIGDWLIFDRMGAYTLSIKSRNSNVPIYYVYGGANS